MTTINPTNALHGHVDETTAYVVDDYPYGFKLRTQIRYWIETNARHGDRFVSQTLNPKTNRWNKPKRSTYVSVACLYLDENGHVKWTGVHDYAEDPFWSEFLAVVDGHLNDLQKDQVARILGLRKAFEGVTYKVTIGTSTPEEKLEQARIERVLASRAARAQAEIRETL